MQKHLDDIRAGRVTKTNVIGIRKALNHIARLDRGLSGNRSNATFDQVDSARDDLSKFKPLVTGELHDSGLKLLQSRRYRKRLESVAFVVDRLDSFALVGLDWIDDLHATPIYEARGGGRSFTFRNVAWQSGGKGPEILRGIAEVTSN